MDHELLVRKAQKGDVDAFVDLTRRFQLFAFGLALAHVGDFQKAEDIVQEAFVAAWLALPTLAEPAAFPGWLRGIVRDHAFRVLRWKLVHTVPLDRGRRCAERRSIGRTHFGAAAPDFRRARRHFGATRLVARARDIVLRSRVFSSRRRNVPRPVGRDRQQSSARCTHPSETKDADNGHRHAASIWTAR